MAVAKTRSAAAPSADADAEDLQLLARVGSGDQRAIASLYERHSNLVYSVALRVCHDSVAAEQVLQDIFMQMWLAPRQFAPTLGRLDEKLGLLSRNVAIELMRRRISPGTGESPSPSRPFDPIQHKEVSRLMQRSHALVLLLPNADRRLLEMAFFDGKSRVEMADEMGVPAHTIGSRLRGALSILRNGAAEPPEFLEDTGLEVWDLDTHPEFASRGLHIRDVSIQMEGLRRLTHSFLEKPETILQELVTAAVELCGADSAGISLETEEKSDTNYYHWVATAGQYNGFLNAVLPRYPSACGICLERGKPQLFRVGQRFFDIMGIEAPLVTDGILLPWQVEGSRGTIFVMAHGRAAAFNKDDGQMMRVLADFAAMAVRHHRRQGKLLKAAEAAAGVAMASKIATPLQSLISVASLAVEGGNTASAETLGQKLSVEVQRLSDLMAEPLAPQRPDESYLGSPSLASVHEIL